MRLIDADRLCEDLLKRWEIADKEKDAIVRGLMADIVAPIVIGQPTIDPVKHGRWIYSAGFDLDGAIYAGRYQCDQCNHWIDAGDDRNYCPNCGAKMDGESYEE